MSEIRGALYRMLIYTDHMFLKDIHVVYSHINYIHIYMIRGIMKM